MSRQGTGYDLTASQFSPEGSIFQVSYARRAVDNSGTAVAMRGKDGVVFAVEKIITSKLHESGAGKRTYSVDRHIGLAVSGLLSDGRQLAEISKEEAANFRREYGSDIPVNLLAERVSSYMQAYTLFSALRPFGSILMMGSWTKEDGPKLYCMDPAGQCFGYYGMSAGRAAVPARTMIEKLGPTRLTCAELVKEAAKIIHEVHDEARDKEYELELSWVTKSTGGVHQPVPEDVMKAADEFGRKGGSSDGSILSDDVD